LSIELYFSASCFHKNKLLKDKLMNRITSLFGIKYPVIQGGMVWCSGWRLASAVSNAGGLGLLGAGSMHPETLREHIRKCRAATHHSFGVNIPLMYPQIEEIMQIVVDEGVRIVFTSAGNPTTWTAWLKQHGITVVHVVSSSRFAMKAEAAGVDAIVAEGFEAGGHNGREETTTLCLIPAVRAVTSLPLIAAGGIATGEAILAMRALGAEAGFRQVEVLANASTFQASTFRLLTLRISTIERYAPCIRTFICTILFQVLLWILCPTCPFRHSRSKPT
jgi:hypothetical protein